MKNLYINEKSLSKFKKKLAVCLVESSMLLALPLFAFADYNQEEEQENTVEIISEYDENMFELKNVESAFNQINELFEEEDFSEYPRLISDSENVYYHYSTKYECTEEEFDMITKIVHREAGGKTYTEKYVDSMAVLSVALNRIEDERWSYLGSTPCEQLTAEGQFAGYESIEGLNSEDVPDSVKTACRDTLDGIRNNDFVEFRAKNNKKKTRVKITENGNNYFNEMVPIEIEEAKIFAKK